MIQELDAEGWVARLRETPRPGTDNVLAILRARMGAICREPKLMLAPLDDHLVHRGDGVFESLRMAEGAHPATGCAYRPAEGFLRRHRPDAALPVGRNKNHTAGSGPRGRGRPTAGSSCCSAGAPASGRGPARMPAEQPVRGSDRNRPLAESYWEKGLTACRSAVPAKQPYLARIKSTNYLPNVLMAQEAARRGVDVSFSFDEAGCLAEAAVANVAVADGEGRLLLPPFRHSLPAPRPCWPWNWPRPSCR